MQAHAQYLRSLRRQGYVTRRSPRTGHFKIYDPNGCLVGVHSGNGGSDPRSLHNLKADVRRHVCSAGEQQSEHVQGQSGRDERRPDRARGYDPRHDSGDREQQERDQYQEAVYAAHGEAVS